MMKFDCLYCQIPDIYTYLPHNYKGSEQKTPTDHR